jgi:hypothetical protein
MLHNPASHSWVKRRIRKKQTTTRRDDDDKRDNIKTKGQQITITAKTLAAAMAEPHIEGKPATVARRLNRKEHKLVENSVENIFPSPAEAVQFNPNFAASPINIISVWQL